MPKKVTASKKAPSNTKNIKIALMALAILVLLVIIGKILALFISLEQPITSSLNIHKSYAWDKKSSYNVALVTNPLGENPDISVLSYQPSEQKAVILHLSNSIYTDVAKGYGKWRLGSVYSLGNEESQKRGGELLKLTLTRLLAIPIDGVVLLPESTKYPKTENLVESFRKDLIPDLFYLSDIQSDLTKWEAFQLYQSLAKVRSDKIDSLDFERSTITESKLLPDTSRVLGVNTVRLDLFIREKLADPVLVDENVPVAIFNATNQLGLAQEVARTITNMGGNVIIVQNIDNKQPKSQVVVTNQTEFKSIKDSVTFGRITQFIAPDCLKKSCQLNEIKIADSRATINIIIGEDYINQWYKK